MVKLEDLTFTEKEAERILAEASEREARENGEEERKIPYSQLVEIAEESMIDPKYLKIPTKQLVRESSGLERPEVKLPPISLINRLVKENFGRKYAGNFLRWCAGTSLWETDKLAVIGHKRILGGLRESLNLGNDETIGRFESQDGRTVRVLPEYAEQAKRYAESYERIFGGEARVIIDNNATDLSSVSGYTWSVGP